MVDPRRVTNAAMQALIDGAFGCLDAAAATIAARLGHPVGKGTLSKRLSGQLGWPVDEVVALEDAAGRYPVTQMMARRLRAAGPGAAACIYAASGCVSKEVGEAVSAALSAAQSADVGDTARALAEIDEGIAALREMRRAVDALEDRT